MDDIESSPVSYSVKDSVAVDSIGNNEYRGRNLWKFKFMRAVYGGQVMGQALMAACKCVFDLSPTFLMHSFHCYFVGPMQTSPEVIYKVTPVKNGHSFCSLSVAAVQGGKVCFHCLVSFQNPEGVKAELDYSKYPKPKVPHPNDSTIFSALTESDTIAVSANKLLMAYKGKFANVKWPMDVYFCSDVATAKRQLARKPVEPKMSLWIRGQGAYEETEHQNCHRLALAYSSDFLMAGLLLNAYPKFLVGLQTSLDHSMWFHDDVNSQQWHLYCAEVEQSVSGKALNSQRIFNEDGKVVASCTQESLIRPKL